MNLNEELKRTRELMGLNEGIFDFASNLFKTKKEFRTEYSLSKVITFHFIQSHLIFDQE